MRFLIEGKSKKSADYLFGRTTHNTTVVFPKENYKKGDFVMVNIENCTFATLLGKLFDMNIQQQNKGLVLLEIVLY